MVAEDGAEASETYDAQVSGGRCRSVILGKRRGTPSWVDDIVQRQEGQSWRTGEYVDSPLEGILTAGGLGRGYR